VWCISLECAEQELAGHRKLLSEDEGRRADKFLFDRHRRRFAVGRSKLRQILAKYVPLEPAEIDFEYSGLGKPRLAGARLGCGLCFNFSNSHERALLAVARDVELGIDIERMRVMENLAGLAERYFAEVEKNYILGQTAPAQTASFFHCWTRKEAFLKAFGKGLTFPLRDVTVELRPEAAIRIVDIKDQHEKSQDWTLVHVEVEPEYVGAIACRRLDNRISHFRLAN
jgi:4'-phosphopantetheinyl transferase